MVAYDAEGVERDRLISCRRLDGNSITTISADAFTSLPQLQTLFVLYVLWMLMMSDHLCVVCICGYFIADVERIVGID